mgnify:FL=1
MFEARDKCKSRVNIFREFRRAQLKVESFERVEEKKIRWYLSNDCWKKLELSWEHIRLVFIKLWLECDSDNRAHDSHQSVGVLGRDEELLRDLKNEKLL